MFSPQMQKTLATGMIDHNFDEGQKTSARRKVIEPSAFSPEFAAKGPLQRVLGVLIGWTVELHSLEAEHLNGRSGIVLSMDTARSRVGVEVDGKVIGVKPENLRHIPTDGATDDWELADTICNYIDDSEAEALDEALADEDWGLAVELLGGMFRVGDPSTTIDELRKEVRDDPSCAPWVDPRIEVGWDALDKLDQYNKLSTFLAHAVQQLGFAVVEALRDPRLEVGINYSLLREGIEPRGKLDDEDIPEALCDHLIKNTLRPFGTLEFASTNDEGQGWRIMTEILNNGAPAIFYALSITKFLRTITSMIIERMEKDGRLA